MPDFSEQFLSAKRVHIMDIFFCLSSNVVLQITENLDQHGAVHYPFWLKNYMTNTSGRLTLAELKAKADQSNIVENLEAIQGGNLFNCHGNWGQVGKKAGAALERLAERAINRAIDKL